MVTFDAIHAQSGALVQYPIIRPALVEQALGLAVALGFAVRPEGNAPGDDAGASCCMDAVGSLLQTLCASLDGARIGEIGTGAGVGTAWLAAGLRPGSTLVSVEIDSRLSTAVARLFVSEPAVRITHGDWRDEFAADGPYDLLFADGGGIGGGPSEWETLARLVRPGGMLLMDDLTPEQFWPASWRGQPDPKRELAFTSGLFTATEVRTGERTSALVMVRK